jgi:hypothetical protein
MGPDLENRVGDQDTGIILRVDSSIRRMQS